MYQRGGGEGARQFGAYLNQFEPAVEVPEEALGIAGEAGGPNLVGALFVYYSFLVSPRLLSTVLLI